MASAYAGSSENQDGFQTKVHFPVDQVQQHDAEILVKPESDTKLAIHLGFLQVHHCYKVTFSIRDALSEDITYNPLQNLHAKIVDYMPTEDGLGHELTVDLIAHKEKLWKEEVSITDSTDPTKHIALVLFARVLGKGKGTPMLKRGIKCTGINAEDDSEQSDWQGFD